MKNSFLLLSNKKINKPLMNVLKERVPYIPKKEYLFENKTASLYVVEQPWVTKEESGIFQDKEGLTVLKGYILYKNKNYFLNSHVKELHKLCLKKKVQELKDNFDGEFILIHISKDVTFGFNNFSGSRSFFFSNTEKHFISSDISCVVNEVRNKLKLDSGFNILALSHFAAKLDGMHGNFSIYKETYKFDPESFFTIDSKCKIIKSDAYLKMVNEMRKLYKKDREQFYNEITTHFSNMMKIIVRSFNKANIPVSLRLSGGLDSRLILAAIKHNKDTDKLNIRSVGYAFEVDRIVGTYIAEKLNIPVISKPYLSPPSIDHFKNALKLSIYYLEVLSNPPSVNMELKPFSPEAQLNGQEAGLRTEFPKIHSKQDLIKFFDYSNPHPSMGMNYAHTIKEKWKQNYNKWILLWVEEKINQGYVLEDIPVLWCIQHRCLGRHSSRSLTHNYYNFFIQPFLDKKITAASCVVTNDERKNACIHYELMCRLDEDLLYIPFNHEPWHHVNRKSTPVKLKYKEPPILSPLGVFFQLDDVLKEIKEETITFYNSKKKKNNFIDDIFDKSFLNNYFKGKTEHDYRFDFMLWQLAFIEKNGHPKYENQDKSSKKLKIPYDDADNINVITPETIYNLDNYYRESFKDILFDENVRAGLGKKIFRPSVFKNKSMWVLSKTKKVIANPSLFPKAVKYLKHKML